MASVKGSAQRPDWLGGWDVGGFVGTPRVVDQLSADARWPLLTCLVWAVPKQGCAAGVGVGVLQVVQGFCGGKVDGAGVDC